MNSKVDRINKYLDVNSSYILQSLDAPDSILNGSFQKFLGDMEKIDGISNLCRYKYNDIGNSIFNKELLSINYNMMDLLKLKIHSGRTFNEADFSNIKTCEKVPIIIGSNLNNIYKVGDIIKTNPDKSDKYQFQVIGVLDPNQEFFKEDILSEGLLNLDDSIILPADFDYVQEVNSYNKILFTTSSNSEEVLSAIKTMSVKHNNIRLSISNIKTLVEAQYKTELKLFKGYLIINISMVVFSLFGIVLTMIMLCESRKREFGIRLAAGCTKSYLYKFILGEMMAIDALGFVIALSVYKIYDQSIIKSTMSMSFFQMYTFKIIGTMVGISIALIMIFSLDVVRRLYKMEPRELIKGRD